MIVLIAEKPSFGMMLARLTGCRERGDGYMDGGLVPSGPLAGKRCCVTWAFGHLLELTTDEETKALHWKMENLPVVPPKFLLEPRRNNGKPDPGCIKQLEVIRKLISKSEAIVNCGDAGREGELIQRYIYGYCALRDPSCNKPVWRMWVSSNTDEALRKSIMELRPGNEYDNLFEAARSRAEADWLIGINSTEALTLNIKRQLPFERRVFSLGRVQTPILALVCERYLENKYFVPTPFWEVKLKTTAKGIDFEIKSKDRFNTFEEANTVASRCNANTIRVDEVTTEERHIKPPLLHDITSLQQEASARYGYDPDETLKIVQKLYEDKLVTYPRTGSRFITKDVFHTIPERIRALSEFSQDQKVMTAALKLFNTPVSGLNRRCVRDENVTDHHALLVEKTNPEGLSGKEAEIYSLIASRMLEAFSGECLAEVYSVLFACAGCAFTASSAKTLQPGWKSVLGEQQRHTGGNGEDAEEAKLPPLNEGDILPVLNSEVLKGETKPKPIYTMKTLLDAIKTAGKESGDDDIKEAMKNIGIGTPATRAEIIKTLMDTRKFIKKEKGEKVLPTETGLEIYKLVKNMSIANVELTGRWEIALNNVAEGKTKPEVFNNAIRKYTSEIVTQITGVKAGDGLSQAAQAENITCPLCGGLVKVWENNAKCTNPECGLYMNRTAYGKRLSESTIKYFLETGKTGIIKGFTSKTGRKFDARLKRVITEKEGRLFANCELDFEQQKPGYKKTNFK